MNGNGSNGNGAGSIEDARRELERLFGYPSGAFDPAGDFFKDVERINRALGEGFKLLQDTMSPENLRDMIETFHMDSPVGDIRYIGQKITGVILPDTNGYHWGH